ncbi:MAG: fumarate hydratase [Anaerolineae bacterium]|nr:fumarate hydratase [Anaerolineae bacterium]
MREISTDMISQAVASLAIAANHHLPSDVQQALHRAREAERSPVGREILDQIIDNANIAAGDVYPLCQDTGLTVVWIDLGQDVHVVGGDLEAAIQEGVRQGYRDGYLRKSIVERPFSARTNTGDNTPAVIHFRIVPGERLQIAVCPKGGGSENMSALGMLKPADGRAGVVDFVTGAVDRAGANPCPPLIVGVGIGGSAEQAMLLAKYALLRPVGQPHADLEVASLEREILERVNALGIGPQGLGGHTTALSVHVEPYPCHIASLPVGVNLQCHSARHQKVTL